MLQQLRIRVLSLNYSTLNCSKFLSKHSIQALEELDNHLPEDYASPLVPWSKIIRKYTGCSLIHESDRLIAIAGLARISALALDYKYIARLWESHLSAEIFWHRPTHS